MESIDVSKDSSSHDRNDGYFNYSVAKSLFIIQVAASSSATPGGPASVGQSPSPPTATTQTTAPNATTPTAWTLNGTLTATATSAAPASTPSGPNPGSGATPTDATYCGAITAQYAADQTLVATEIATYKNLMVRLALLAAEQPAKGDTPAIIAKAGLDYVAQVQQGSYRDIFFDGFLPGREPAGARNKLPEIYKEIAARCPPNVTVTIQQTVVPDTSRTFVLKARTNLLYADGLTLNVDANGFLTNGGSSSTSEVPAILSSVATDVGTFTSVGPSSVSGAAVRSGKTFRESRATTLLPSCRPYDAGIGAQLADLAKCKSGAKASLDDAKNAASLAAYIRGDLIWPGTLPNLPAAALPITLYASIADLRPHGDPPKQVPPFTPDPTTISISDRLEPYEVSIWLDCSPRAGAAIDQGPERRYDWTDLDHPITHHGVYDGFIVSAPRACRFLATQTRPGPSATEGDSQQIPITQTYLWAQDSQYLVRLPTSRGLLVAQTVTYQFAGGQATGVTDSRPSEIQALVALPSTIAGAFFSGLATAVTNSQTLTSAKAANLNAQTTYLNAEANALAAKNTLSNERQGIFPSSLGSPGSAAAGSGN